MKAARGLTVERMVKLGRVSRSGFYRLDDAEPGPDPDMDLRDAMQKIAVEWPAYGRPRMTKELRERGWTVNPKRVYRLMREDNLLCVRKRKFVVTTDSNHTRKVYPNLARDLVPTAINQLWRADIPYIRLRDEFVFLAVILDAYSRRVIGWALDRTMEDSLTLTALRVALSRRSIPRNGAEPGLVHHPDRGSQYASSDYTDLLRANGIEISMSRKGNPWDNAACESFMKTLKDEEVLRNEYRNLADATPSTTLAGVEKLVSSRPSASSGKRSTTNKRLHSALGYMPPARFERNQKDAAARHLFDLFEPSGRHVAQRGMQAFFVVDLFPELADGRASVEPGLVIVALSTSSSFSVFMNDSQAALSHGLPLRDMLISMPLALSRSV